MACMLVLACSVSSAVEVMELFVLRVDGGYRLRIVSRVDAPAAYVREVVTDYRHAYRINPAVTQVELLPAARADSVRVRNRSEHRVGPFRMSVDWVGEIREGGHGIIHVDTVPGLGDFDSGSAVWIIHPRGEQTWVLHDSLLSPAFYIPPLIGDYLMKTRLKSGTLDTFNRIECHARARFELDMMEAAEREGIQAGGAGDCSGGAGSSGPLAARLP